MFGDERDRRGEREWLDLAFGLQVENDQDVRDEAYEVFVAEASRVRLADRVGSVRLQLRSGRLLVGAMDPGRAGEVTDHLWLVEQGGRALLVPSSAVDSMTGARPGLRPEDPSRPQTITSWLRAAWLADAALAALTGRGNWVTGRVVHVGADHVDLDVEGRVVTVAIGSVEAWARE